MNRAMKSRAATDPGYARYRAFLARERRSESVRDRMAVLREEALRPYRRVVLRYLERLAKAIRRR
jgi:hypothetical protein